MTSDLDLTKMTDITFWDISYSDFISPKIGRFILREEVEGIQVGLLQTNDKYRVLTMLNGKELYSTIYPKKWKLAYEEYKKERDFVRHFFIQKGRKEIFYFKDIYGNVLSIIYK